MTEREPSPAALEKAMEVWGHTHSKRGKPPCAACVNLALALDDFAAQAGRVEPSEKETGR